MALPQPPKTIKVSALRYTVHFNRTELAQAQKDMGGSLLGATNHEKLTIVVDPGVPFDQQADTLLHEVEHAIFYVAGIKADNHSDRMLTEEEIIERTNTIRLGVLRENPKLLSFVIAGG